MSTAMPARTADVARRRRVQPYLRLGDGPLRFSVPLPVLPVVAWLAVRALVRHWRAVGVAVVLVAGRVWLGSWLAVVVVLGVLAGAALTGRAMVHRRGSAGDHGKALQALRRKRTVLRRWQTAAGHAKLAGTSRGRTPKLRRVRTGRDGTVTGHVAIGRAGGTTDDLSAASNQLRQSIGARDVKVHETGPGKARLTFLFGDALAQTIPLVRLPAAPPGRATFGLHEDGSAASLSLSTSTLVVGMSGTGKSMLVWSLLASLRRSGVPVRLRVIDPLRVEFAELGAVEGEHLGSMRVHEYCPEGGKAAVEVFRHAVKAMHARLATMPEGVRTHIPTVAEPLDMTIVDELLACDELIKAGGSSDLTAITTGGRKAGFIVVALSQVGHADTLGALRRTFPQRVCLGTQRASDTDTVLGPGAERDGARCSKITQAGVCYVYDETARGYEKARSVFVPDAATRRIARGTLDVQAGPQAKHRAWVYRWYSASGELLYVGKSVDPQDRAHRHEDRAWFQHAASCTVAGYPSEALALAAEREAIIAETPTANVQHNRKRVKARA